jgi:hypothetical protein
MLRGGQQDVKAGHLGRVACQLLLPEVHLAVQQVA